GATVKLFPLFEKKGQKEVTSWFGSDPVTIGRGKGLISLKAKYFNDEVGVPPEVATDRVFILMVNQTGTILLSRILFLKTIKWGSPDAKPPTVAAPVVGIVPAQKDI